MQVVQVQFLFDVFAEILVLYEDLNLVNFGRVTCFGIVWRDGEFHV